MPVQETDAREKANRLSEEILTYSRNMLFMGLRFMENALSRLVFAPYAGDSIGTDSRYLYYNSDHVLRLFRENSPRITRTYLHSVLHCVFQHGYVASAVDRVLWDTACDIAVEVMLSGLQLPCVDSTIEAQQAQILSVFADKVKPLTAEKLYYFFRENHFTEEQCRTLREAFALDDHTPWYAPGTGSDHGSHDSGDAGQQNDTVSPSDDPEQDPSGDAPDDGVMSPQEAEETWKKIARQMQVDLETFHKQRGTQAGDMIQNLSALNRERYDYADFLRKFAVFGEVMRIDDDTFDYSFYTYGMQLYGNMPLIEPLEYKDEKRIREFVIAIDTSGSVRGKTVQRFLQKTYNILKQQESFFSKVNIHIIQCDAEIQEAVKITDQEGFDSYLSTMQLHGFGGTDFRPVFAYVEELIRQKELTDLQGLLYFTDGYGTFPQRQTPYRTAFIFLENGSNNYEVPVWAMRVILEEQALNDSSIR